MLRWTRQAGVYTNQGFLSTVGSTVTNPADLRFLYEGHEDFGALPTFLVLQGVSTLMESSLTTDVFAGKEVNPARVSHILTFLSSAHDVIPCHPVAQVSLNICKLCFKFLRELSEC